MNKLKILFDIQEPKRMKIDVVFNITTQQVGVSSETSINEETQRKLTEILNEEIDYEDFNKMIEKIDFLYCNTKEEIKQSLQDLHGFVENETSDEINEKFIFLYGCFLINAFKHECLHEEYKYFYKQVYFNILLQEEDFTWISKMKEQLIGT